jgi:hypothetical protein
MNDVPPPAERNNLLKITHATSPPGRASIAPGELIRLSYSKQLLCELPNSQAALDLIPVWVGRHYASLARTPGVPLDHLAVFRDVAVDSMPRSQPGLFSDSYFLEKDFASGGSPNGLSLAQRQAKENMAVRRIQHVQGLQFGSSF